MNDETRKGDWMQTFTGRQFWPIDPRPDEIDLLDVAHGLSMICRYGGHAKRFYSVAEHCCHLFDFAMTRCPQEVLAWVLMHDASEAYLGDIPRPLKPFLPGYKALEAKMTAAVAVRFNLVGDEPAFVKQIDLRITGDEAAQNMAAPPTPWADTGPILGVELRFWKPADAKRNFLHRAAMLGLK